MSACHGADCANTLPPPKGPGRKPMWCSERCRKRSYDLSCVVCGGRVDGTTPSSMHDRDNPVCGACAPGYYRVWTPEAMLLVIQEWADEHGGIPPAVEDLRRAKRNGHSFPTPNYVIQTFGSWNKAIIAAGYEPHACGPVGGFTPLTPAQRRACARRYAAGESSIDIAADFGCAPQSVLKWVRKAGVPVRPNFAQARAAA